MFWPAKEDYYLGSYNERCEQELVATMRETDSETLSLAQLRASESFTIAQKIARDFESTYHLLKSTDREGTPIELDSLVDHTTLVLSRPTLNIPVIYPGGSAFEIAVDLKNDKKVLYYDIQPTSSTVINEEGKEARYHGAHLLGLVHFEDAVTLENGFELPIDTYLFYMPFKDLRISSEHRGGIFN